eukprot:3906480-Prorocentrum_lima.AAC.1
MIHDRSASCSSIVHASTGEDAGIFLQDLADRFDQYSSSSSLSALAALRKHGLPREDSRSTAEELLTLRDQYT